MAALTILYLGRPGFAWTWRERLEASAVCARLYAADALGVPDTLPAAPELVLFEAGPRIARSRVSLAALLRSLSHYPVVALTDREHEHRGIAAVRAGAQGYLSVDDADDATARDVFEHAIRRHRLLTRLSENDGTVLSILNSINDGAIVVDRHGRVLDINPAARSMLGLPPRQNPGEAWVEDFCRLDADGETRLPASATPLERARRGERFTEQLAVYRGPERTETLLSLNGQGLYDSAQSLIGGVVTFRDVTDLVHRTLELEKRAEYDELTLLPNRRLFTRQLGKAIGRAERIGKPLALLFIDLDRFKSVNDTLGHDVGDGLLRQVADRMQRHVRIGDFCGRWGGDEFVLCLEDVGDERDAGAAAQKLILLLAERYAIGGSEVYTTPSIGIAVYPGAARTPDELIKAADLAMYQAKKRGGGRYQYYAAALNTKLEQREELELGLRHALVRREFLLHYQPRIDVGSGRLIGLEALLRWQHPRFGLLPPARFLPILESSGLIHSAGEWVLGTACRQLIAWQREFELPDLSVAINLSPRQLVEGRLVSAVSKALSDNALDPGCIELELSGGNIVSARAAELETLRGLRRLGVRLSLDHFGTRDVSFASLDTGVIDSFVLDHSLIQDVEVNDSHQRIVRAAIAMARGLDIEVAAEGVETVTQLDFLQSCACDLAQGFLIARPMQAEKVARILRSEIAGRRLLERGMP